MNMNDEWWQDKLDAANDDIARLSDEVERLRAFIKDVVLNYDPRSDIYATELHGDAHEALGHCRCCGQKVCDDA